MTTLTGRTRYRVTWLGALVLQIEERFELEPVFSFEPEVWLEWRDARCEDFNAFGDLFHKAPVPYPGQRPLMECDHARND